MKINKLMTIAGLGLSLTIGGSVMAQHGDQQHADYRQPPNEGGGTVYRQNLSEHGDYLGMGHHFMQRIFAKLDLSDQQQEDVKGILMTYRQQMAAKMGEFGDFRTQMKTQVQTNSFDESAVRALIESKQANRIEAGIATAKMKNQIWNVLNPEQQAKLSDLMDNMGKRGKHMMRTFIGDVGI